MEQFASGWKRSYYGKGDVIVYRLNRDGTDAGRSESGVRRERADAGLRRRVLADLYDRRQHRAHRDRLDEELHPARDDELSRRQISRATASFSRPRSSPRIRRSKASRCLRRKFRTPGLAAAGRSHLLDLSAPPRASSSNRERVVEARSGIRGFRLLRLGGSAFHGFVRDEYTTLPDLMNRPLHMWLDLDWTYTDPAAAFNDGQTVAAACAISCTTVFESFESGSIQQLIHRIGTRMLDDNPSIARGPPRSEQPDVGYDCRARKRARRLHRRSAAVRLSRIEPQTITMARLSTHVLDTSRGTPAAGIRIELHFVDGGSDGCSPTSVTNADGRTDAPLLSARPSRGRCLRAHLSCGRLSVAARRRTDRPAVSRTTSSSASASPSRPVTTTCRCCCRPYGYSVYRGS